MWTREKLRSRVSYLHTTQYTWEFLPEPLKSVSKAAVLIPLVLEEDGVKVWLTKRSEHVTHFKGDVSFPGGKKDPSDIGAVDTALREAYEEIGLESSQVEVLGELPPRVNLTPTVITPVVAIVSNDFHPRPNDEVSIAFKLPLARFLSNEGHWTRDIDFMEYRDFLHFFDDVVSEGTVTTWGMTASILVELACGILQKRPEFSYSLNVELTPEEPFVLSMNHLAKIAGGTLEWANKSKL